MSGWVHYCLLPIAYSLARSPYSVELSRSILFDHQRLTPNPAIANLQQYQASLRQAQASLVEAEARLAQAKTDRELVFILMYRLIKYS